MLFYLLVNLVIWMWGIGNPSEPMLGFFAFLSFIEYCIEIWFLVAFMVWYFNKKKTN